MHHNSILIKIQLDATVRRYLCTARSLYMFRVSLHPSLGVLKTVQFLVLLMMGAVTPETCRVTL